MGGREGGRERKEGSREMAKAHTWHCTVTILGMCHKACTTLLRMLSNQKGFDYIENVLLVLCSLEYIHV